MEIIIKACLWFFAIGGILSIAGVGAWACERYAELRSIRRANREEARRMLPLAQFERRYEDVQ